MDPSERYCYNPKLQWNPEVRDYFIKAYGADHFSRIADSLTRPSCYSCIRVNTLKSTSDAVICKLSSIIQETGIANSVETTCLDGFDAIVEVDSCHKEINLSNESSVHQTLRDTCCDALQPTEDMYYLRATLDSGRIVKCNVPGLDYVVLVKGSGPHSIEYGYEQERPPKEVIVSRKCAEAVLRGAQVYVPGVLACSGHVEKGDTVAVSVAVEQLTSDGGWGVGITRGTVLQGCQTDPHYFERHGLYIGQGTAMMSRAGIFRVLQGVAVDMSNKVFSLPSFHDVLEGEIFLQNLPSIVVAHALDPQQGERILDMCAAPGGKTTAIAMLMKDKGEVVATDRSHNKVLDIRKLAAELGLNCITTYKLDALKAVCHSDESNQRSTQSCEKDSTDACIPDLDSLRLPVENISDSTTKGPNPNADSHFLDHVSGAKGNQRSNTGKANVGKDTRRLKNGPGKNQSLGGKVEKLKGFFPNSFDRVLLDAPCSALGLRPRLFFGEETITSLKNHAKYQKRMFDQAVQLVRPGGVIVYSTCTINPGENEALVRYALDTHKFLSLASQHPRIGGPGLVGSCCFSDGYIEEWLRPGEEELVQRFDPSSPLDTIGFFIAKFHVGNKGV